MKKTADDKKRIFVLGAGSSISHSQGLFPSINDFFLRAIDHAIGDKSDLRELDKYIRIAFGKNIARDKVNIEDVLTRVDIEIEQKPSPDLLMLRERLIKLIQTLLIELGNKVGDNQGHYNYFTTQILTSRDTIITFNWDLLLDNLLNRESIIDENKPREGQYWQMYFLNTGYWERTIAGQSVDPPYRAWGENWKSREGHYIKMHGSLDWYYCVNEMCRARGRPFPMKLVGERLYCFECFEPMEILMVPPVLNKGIIQQSLIRRIWNLAKNEITTCQELIIWGYSLPATDFYSAWLLGQARLSEMLEKLVVINPDKSENVLERLVQPFRDKLSEHNIVLFNDFDEYISAPKAQEATE